MNNKENKPHCRYDSFKALRDFLFGRDNIVIYGAGNYGHLMAAYFRKKEYNSLAVVVSDTEKIEEPLVYGFPVKHIGDISTDVNVVLALNSKHHDEIFSGPLENVPRERILVLQDSFFDHTLKFLLFLSGEEEAGFRDQAETICRNYKVVEFCTTTMQCFGLMMFFAVRQSFEENPERVFRVYIPDFYRWDETIDLETENPGNPYFYGKLKEKYSFLDAKNASFWKYFIDRFPERVRFRYEWMWNGMEAFQHSHWGNGSLTHNRAFFSLDKKEESERDKYLVGLGVKIPYVCFNVRSERYFAEKGINDQRTQPQSNQRNCSLEKFQIMCEALERKGLQAVRMGFLGEGEIRGANVIDYSLLPRNPFLDYALISKCHFVVCQFSGFHYMAILFNKPTVITDAINLTINGDIADTVNLRQDIMLLKKIYSPELGRCLTFREMLDFEVKFPNLYERTTYYREHDYSFVENSGEEIAEAACEMVKRLEGSIEYDDEYLNIQREVSRIRKEAAAKAGSCYWDIPLAEYYIKTNLWLLD